MNRRYLLIDQWHVSFSRKRNTPLSPEEHKAMRKLWESRWDVVDTLMELLPPEVQKKVKIDINV